MKVTTKAVYSCEGILILEESYEYCGEFSMCGGGGKSSTPEITPPPEPVQKVQTKAISESAQVARQNQLEKAQRAKGIKSTILTNEEEEDPLLSNKVTHTSTTNTKSLLGQ